MGDSLETTAAVLTRAQSIASGKPQRSLSVPMVEKLQLSVADMPQLHRDSPDLVRYFQLADSGKSIRSGRSATVKFVVQDELLYRIHETDAGRVTKQLIVPKDQRNRVLSLTHESITSGHLGVNKSLDRVLSQFYWPEVMSLGIAVRVILAREPLQRVEYQRLHCRKCRLFLYRFAGSASI